MARIIYGYHGYERLPEDGGKLRKYSALGEVTLEHGYDSGEQLSAFNHDMAVNMFGSDADDAISSAIAQLRDIQASVRDKASSIPSFPQQYVQLKNSMNGWADQLDNTIALMPDWAADPTKFQGGMALVQKTLQQGRDIVNSQGVLQEIDDKFVSFMAWLPGATKAGLNALIGGAGDVLRTAAFSITTPILILGGGLILLIFLARKSGLRGRLGPVALQGYGGRRKRRRKAR
jgi:ABC-type transporter Mla subunit MlaD